MVRTGWEKPCQGLRGTPSGLSPSSQESVFIWTFSTQSFIQGDLYKGRANISDKVEQSDASLTIDQLTMDDNGTYECSVTLLTDLVGNSNSRVRLLVLGECLHLPPGRQDAGEAGRGCKEEKHLVVGYSQRQQSLTRR